MKKYFVLTFIAWIFCFVALQVHAALTAQLDRDKIIEGETVQLKIEAAGRVSEMPNTEILNKDFEVMGVMSGSRVNIINGNIDSRTTWTLTLSPKRNGELTIPSLTINSEQTPILTLQVSETSANTGSDTTAPVFIKTEIDKTDPYVQGKVRYTLRLFFAVNLAQGSLSEPKLESALVHRLGEDREYTTMQDGKSYHVIEREYIIFPQTSGDLVIPAPVLDAQIPQNISQRDQFFGRVFTNSRPIRLRGETITLKVRPRPSQSQSEFWLPAESVELLETWQPDDDQIAVGDPLTRNITIKAIGVTGEQLPDLQFTDVDGLKLYPDRAQSNTQNLQHNVQGEKTLRLAYMPTKPGKYTLPELSLHWWDTRTNQEQIETLAARTIEIIPATSQTQEPLTKTTDLATAKSSESTVQKPFNEDNANHLIADEDNINETTTLPLNYNRWFWASLIFAALWLITLGLWWRRRHFLPQDIENNNALNTEPKNSNQARKCFLSACQANDAQQARHHLLQWAASHWLQSPPKGLEDLALRLNDPAISAALKTLDRILYQGNNENWNGQELAKLLSKLPLQNQQSTDKAKLPRLYE